MNFWILCPSLDDESVKAAQYKVRLFLLMLLLLGRCRKFLKISWNFVNVANLVKILQNPSVIWLVEVDYSLLHLV